MAPAADHLLGRKEALMTLVSTEHVLVVPTRRFEELGYFQGFCHDPQPYLAGLFSAEHLQYRPRDAVESDPSFKQLIPYVVFQYRRPDGTIELFQYTRGRGQGERRLHALQSIGVGGHISSTDGHCQSAYAEGMRRELAEEVEFGEVRSDRCVGLINDDQTDVGRVHLGIVHVIDLAAPQVEPREPDILDAGFRPMAALAARPDRFESWSRICLEELFPAADHHD
jgi:predicted NUDIX family phosphoesterase